MISSLTNLSLISYSYLWVLFCNLLCYHNCRQEGHLGGGFFCLPLIRCVLMVNVKTWKECVESDLKRLNLDPSMAADHELWHWLVRACV